MGSLTLVRHAQASFGAADYDRLSDRGAEQARALGVRWAGAPPAAIYTGPMRRQVDTARIARDAARASGCELPEAIELPGLAEFPAFELLARFLPEVAREHAELRGLVDPPADALIARQLGAGPDHHRWDGSASGGTRTALFDLAFWKVLEGWALGRFELGDIESYGAFVERVQVALGWMTARHQRGGERIAAVTSGGPIGVALKLGLGLGDHAMFGMWRVIRNASVTELRWRSREPGRAGELSLLGFNHVDHLPSSLHTFR